MPVRAETTSSSAPTTQSLMAGVLRTYLALATEQVVVYNQKWKIPADDRLYLTISSVGPQQVYGGTTSQENKLDATGKLVEVVETVAVASREMIAVDIYSRSQQAVERKEEVLMALASTQMQQLCEKYSLKVARIPLGFVDLSSIEGTARLNRFHLAFAVLRTRSRSMPIEYYDTFQKPRLVIEP